MNILDIVEQLDQVNYNIAALKTQKENLEALIAQQLHHPENASKTYKLERFKVVLKSGRNYRIDTKAYIESNIPEEIDPVRVATKYEINQAKLRELEGKYGNLYANFISWTPSKLAVNVGANT